MGGIIKRELIYIWYYFEVQLSQIFWYWVIGMAVGSLISVFAKDKIHAAFGKINAKRWGIFGIVPAGILGIASPLCMYGTIPIAASFSKQGMRDDWLAAFMMASILLNPQLIVYSTALGSIALAVRIVSCFLCGCAAAFMITGPATKITNLGALKIVLGVRKFIAYLLFTLLFAFLTGIVTNLLI